MSKGLNPKVPIKINGVTYESYGQAANLLGVNRATLGLHMMKLNKSNLSSLEVTVSIKTKFVFEKIK